MDTEINDVSCKMGVFPFPVPQTVMLDLRRVGKPSADIQSPSSVEIPISELPTALLDVLCTQLVDSIKRDATKP